MVFRDGGNKLMGKKNLVILLALPFIIALLGVSVISATFNLIDTEILAIGWDYDEAIGVKVNSEKELQAYGINNKNYPVTNAKLIWSVSNSDTNPSPNAVILEKNGSYYLKGLQKGNVKLSCSNEKGTIYRYLSGIVYTDSAIVVSPSIKSSQSNVDNNIYYGQYNYDENYNKIDASFSYNITTYGEKNANEVQVLKIESKLENNFFNEPSVDVDNKNKIVTIKNDIFVNADDEAKKEIKASLKELEINITFGFNISDIAKGETYVSKFKVVRDGVNIYNYNELLMATNKSASGEIICLRKSLESLDNAYNFANDQPISLKENNIELFGNYVKSNKKNSFSFDSDIYRFKTTYNDEFIKQWNDFASSNKEFNSISDEVNVGIRVQKDFYGNGYTLNMHNLTYPYEQSVVNNVIVPKLRSDNLFKGPLPFYTLGNPNGGEESGSTPPLVGAYGQDNIGMYVDGDNITINDLNIKNCDFGNNLANLEFTGTVMETHGKNITIKNSRLSSGKTVLKVNSSMNTKLSNCLLSYSRNFLLSVSTDEYEKVDDSSIYNFRDSENNFHNDNLKNYLSYSLKDENASGYGNTSLNEYLMGNFKNEAYIRGAIDSIQDALDNELKTYKCTLDIIDCLFYSSGIASIGMESMFNGPFLYNSSPGIIKQLFYSIGGGALSSVIPYFANYIGGTSYPSRVNICGDTKFYDYKKLDTLDLSGLIMENISEIYNSFAGGNIRDITINDIFPLVSLLRGKIEDAGGLYRIQDENGNWVSYANIPIAYYGGGKNNSEVYFASDSAHTKHLTDPIDLSFLDEYLKEQYKGNGSLSGSNLISTMKNILLKCVTVVTGFNPFKFVCGRDGYLFNETPKVSTLVDNYNKGEY